MMRARPTVLATLTALVVGTVTLAVVAWAAEGGGAPALAATTDESALCQNPQQVLTVGPRDGDITTVFTTTGDAFRVRYDVDFSDDTPLTAAVEIDIVDRFGQLVQSVHLSQDANKSFIVTAGAGTYDLVVSINPPIAATYTVTVDDCGETTAAPTTKEDCKNGGYAKFGFKNQGQCIKAVNHAS
jgi:hypothetical protein